METEIRTTEAHTPQRSMPQRSAWHISFNSPVILGFVGICFLVMALDVLTAGASTKLAFITYHSSLLSPLTYLRFFTHVLGHANWEHLTSNMAYVLLLGPLLEEKYGSRRLLAVMLVSALATSLVNYVFFPLQALCGASGICFSFILLSSVTSFREGEIPLTFILVALLFLGQQVIDGIFVQDAISNMSHIIGGVVGAVSGFMLAPSSA